MLLLFLLPLLNGCATGYTNSAFSKAPKKATSRPYQIRGKWYYPQQHYEYDEMGIASWYGPGFHKKKTATGEIFDQNKITAAHCTLPLPCIAVVTNLENGRMIKLRVNDRGPFVDHHGIEGRIIDVSKKTAELLGFLNKGTAKVRVETVVDESIALHQGLDDAGPPVGFIPSADQKVTVKTLDGTIQVSKTQKIIEYPPVIAHHTPVLSNAGVVQQGRAQDFRQIYLETGAFGHKADADIVLKKFSAHGRTMLRTMRFGDQSVYRIRMGPFINVGKADTMLQRAVKMGYKDAKIIVE